MSTIAGDDKAPTLHWEVRAAKRRALEKARLGRRVLCTDRHSWGTGRIVHKSGGLRVDTPGGVFQVRWDENASASALGQLAFFGEFLELPQLFERWPRSA